MLNYTEIWEQCKKNIILEERKKDSFEMILEFAKILEITNSSVVLGIDSEFNKIIIESEFYRQIKESLSIVLNSNFELVILTFEDFEKIKNEINNTDAEKTELIKSSSIRNDTLNPNYTFSNFIVSNSNKSIYSASMSVAIAGGGKWNPLFIYGGSGLGKTHLLHAIGNQLWVKDQNKRIRYIEARDFSKIIHEAKQGKNIYEEFSNIQLEFEKYDLLLVDDIQFIATQQKTKEIFFNIFNWFLNQKKQVVISSDQFPEELGDFEPRFITRFSSGLIMPILPPDLETAKKIISLKLKQNNFNPDLIVDEAIEFLALNFSTNVRSLEGAIGRILFENIQYGERVITLEIITEIFKNISKNKRGLDAKKIIGAVSKSFSIPVNEITGTSRKKEIILPRHISIYLIKKMTNLSLKEISREFKKDHSTIMSSISKIEKEEIENEELAKTIKKIKKLLT